MRGKIVIITGIISLIFIPLSSPGGELENLKELIEQSNADNRALREKVQQQQLQIEELDKKVAVIQENEAKSFEAGILTGKFIPKLTIKGFNDVNFRTELGSDKELDQDSDAFFLGQFDLFISSKISESVSFLSELVIEFEEDNGTEIDPERLLLWYSPIDSFNIKIGRTHTDLGYWNETFHHGSWFQTTAFRPEIYLFEDDGGILPIHSVGIQLFGVKEIPAMDLEYNFSISNGRGEIPDEIQVVRDGNDQKALNFALTVIPDRIPQLNLGVNLYNDTIPADRDNALRNGHIDEIIFGGNILYLGERAEFLSEFFYIDHDDSVSDKTFGTLGFYVQGSYRFSRWIPYYRFDRIEFDNGDPFYTPNDVDIKKHTLGVRFDLFTWNALKLEYTYNDRDGRDDFSSVTFQSTFTF